MSALLLDSNIWVAAAFPSHEFHRGSMALLHSASRSEPVLFCRATEQSFLRLITTPRVSSHYGAAGITNQHASALIAALRAKPGIAYADEPPGTANLWQRLAARPTASPKVWMDAYLAAFAIASGLPFTTLDQDFKTYEKHGLRLRLLEKG